MSRFGFSKINTRDTQVDKTCPKCRGRLLPSKFGGGVWCPAKCGWKDTTKGRWQKTERPDDYRPLLTPSREQVDIFGAAKDLKDSDHLMIEALAGTGKTTVLTDMAYWYSRRGLSVLCLAFTKRDRTALEKKIPESVAKVWTSNAAGLGILSGYCKQQGVRFDLTKNLNLAYDLTKTRFEQDGLIAQTGEWGKGVRQMLSAVVSLVSKARTTLALSATGAGGLPTHPSDKDWNDLALRFGIEFKEEGKWPLVVQYASALFREMSSLTVMLRHGGTDHDGCVFLPVYHNLTPPGRYDRVLVDEAQDQSYGNRMIAELYRKQSAGRIVAVGDSHQAIYAWRGADQFALDEMTKLMTVSGSIRRFPLNLCRRCAKSIIAEAQKLVPEIETLPDAPEGEVLSMKTEDFYKTLVDQKKGLVLCRANAPLISTCLDLLKQKVPAILVRSNIINEIVNLVKNACEDEDFSTPVEKVISHMDDWRREKISKLAARDGTEGQVQIVEDKVACVLALCDVEGVRTAQDVLDQIGRMFPEGFAADPEKMVVLSTVHGAKGSEADTVYLFSPEKDSGVSLWDAVWSDAIDRDNVLYVGITRAKLKLVYAGMPPTVSRMSEGKKIEESTKPVKTTTSNAPLVELRKHVTGKIERGEAVAVVEEPVKKAKKATTKKVVKKSKK